ncbi:unnamed protein product [Orchesella dallaii]|uniref:TATA-box-binding protein n=1 Tax=Orchesella dallaii TaxID=48710 RepID=A0ABP1S5G4_9HEXA
MEVPDFCRRASQRIAKKRKTEEELDPDYQPDTGKESKSRVAATPGTSRDWFIPIPRYSPTREVAIPGPSRTLMHVTATTVSSESRMDRKKVRRSRAIVDDLRKPAPGLQFIERNEYSVEDWKVKASEISKNLVRVKLENPDTDTDGLAALEYPIHELTPYGSNNPDYTEPRSRNMELEAYDFDFNNLPNYVMGTGKGTPGGPPNWEFKTLWNYELTPLQPNGDHFYDSSMQPWNKRDVTEPETTPDILSIVASFYVGCRLDLKKIANGSRNIEYNPERFAPLIMRVREPKSTALIFGSGRIIVAGTRSEAECKLACRKYTRIINKFGHRGRVLRFEIQNILASCSLKFRVRLNQLCKNKMLGPLSYEPEIFPGLVIPLEHPKMKITVFATGSVLMTGGKSEADVQLGFRKIYPLVRMYAP